MPKDQFVLRDCLWLISESTGFSVYDFDFRTYFDCRTPYEVRDLPAVARVGAFADYASFHQECAELGMNLVHSVEEQSRCTNLTQWFPLIPDLTPKSLWFPEVPSLSQIEEDFELPVFVKGARQTSRHQAAASIIRSAADYERAADIYRSDPILRWQEFVVRELVSLRPVSGGTEGRIPASYEFRTFWWRGRLVGSGRYWFEADDYQWTEEEREVALGVAKQAVDALDCTFLVVDLALTCEGQWIIIECNDGMESGYAGVSPFSIWQKVSDIELASVKGA